jgi:hypothetical protein
VKRLTPEAFDRACHLLRSQARPLDRALFEYRFEGAPAEPVLAELSRFQNRDGGFGRALEPDLRTPSSSALATAIGLRLLKELGCDADHATVGSTVHWLLNAFDPLTDVWRVAPYDVNDHPHAPWWHDKAGSLARTFDDFSVIPRADLVGLLYHYASLAPARWLRDITETTVASIETIEPLGSGGGDDLVCALHLAESEELPLPFKERLLARIRSVVPDAVSRDPGEWGSYCITPLKVAPSPESPIADLIWDALQLHLDYQIDHQTAEGSWDPVWSWGDVYPDAWMQAKLEWRGHLTLETLTVLRAFGRI